MPADVHLFTEETPCDLSGVFDDPRTACSDACQCPSTSTKVDPFFSPTVLASTRSALIVPPPRIPRHLVEQATRI